MTLSVDFAASYNLTQSNNTNQFQNIIDTDKDSNLVITLDNEDNYEFGQININRNVTIR